MKKIHPGEFKTSLTLKDPPAGLSIHAKALWFAGKGDWVKAHELVQDLSDQGAAHIHAFLHRQEGDFSNARYWYSKAGTHMPAISLTTEWEALVVLFIR